MRHYPNRRDDVLIRSYSYCNLLTILDGSVNDYPRSDLLRSDAVWADSTDDIVAREHTRDACM